MMARIVERLKHVINGLISVNPERNSLKQPKGLPLVSYSNIGSQSSESLRESYYKGDRVSAVLPWRSRDRR